MLVDSVVVDAAADAVVDFEERLEEVLEERLKEVEEVSVVLLLLPSSQSVGKSTVLFVLFTATPPVAPVALMRARAVLLVVHKTSLIVE